MVPSAVKLFGIIPGQVIFLVLFALAIYWFVGPLYEKFLWIKTIGRPYHGGKGMTAERVLSVIRQIFGHTKILRTGRSPVPGIMHLFVFYGFLMMQLNNLAIVVEGVTGWHVNLGPLYLFVNLFYVLVAVGCITFAYERYVRKPQRLSQALESLWVLLFIMGLVLTEAGTEAAAIAATGEGAAYAWLTAPIATAFPGIANLWGVFWWGHMAVLGGFMYFLPRSKHIHLLVAPFNLYYAPSKPKGQLSFMDLEDETAEQFGVSALEHLEWKHLMDVMACIECGRCQDQCPAYHTGKALSPKNVIVNMKHHLYEQGPMMALMAAGGAAVATEGPSLIGGVVTEPEIWACTTCRACVEACPLGIDPMEKLVEMRRSLVLMEGSFPQEVNVTFRNLERQGNPWGISPSQREEWSADLNVKKMRDVGEAEYLFWAGCTGCFDNRSQKIVRSTVQLLQEAAVDFAVLGKEEKCTGDPARRIGNEMLFQQLAMENVATLQGYGVQKIITHCPHCVNTIKHEYQQFGLEVEVLHHTQVLSQLVKDGKLKPQERVEAKITYHDSCYLGRYNDVYAPPRDVLEAIPGVQLQEMEQHGSKGMCCGAGGGRMWMEEHEGVRVNVDRTKQALETNPDMVATNCPFCMTMMSDGIQAEDHTGQVEVQDVAELLLRSVKPGGGEMRASEGDG